MTDTRAGFWLLLDDRRCSTVAAVVLFAIFARRRRPHADATCSRARDRGGRASCSRSSGSCWSRSEWSQRTSLLTFALVPQRSRVLAAKLAAGVVLSLAALQICARDRAGRHGDRGPGRRRRRGRCRRGCSARATIYVATGDAHRASRFGAMLLASAPAIVLYFALPAAWSALGSIAFLEGAARWLDSARSLDPADRGADEQRRSGRAPARRSALWMLLPLLDRVLADHPRRTSASAARRRRCG